MNKHYVYIQTNQSLHNALDDFHHAYTIDMPDFLLLVVAIVIFVTFLSAKH